MTILFYFIHLIFQIRLQVAYIVYIALKHSENYCKHT